jgi:hypothetical protein
VRLRLVLSAAAIGLIVLLLVVKPFAAADPPRYWTLRGETNQVEVVKLRLDLQGRVRTFEAHVDMYCSGGSTSSTTWAPSEGGAPARFASRGPRVDAVEVRRYRRAGPDLIVRGVLRGTVSRNRASGTVEMTRSVGEREECASGAVPWRARS